MQGAAAKAAAGAATAEQQQPSSSSRAAAAAAAAAGSLGVCLSVYLFLFFISVLNKYSSNKPLIYFIYFILFVLFLFKSKDVEGMQQNKNMNTPLAAT